MSKGGMDRAHVDEDEDEDSDGAQHTPWQADWERNAVDSNDENDQLVQPDDSASNVESVNSPPPLVAAMPARAAGALAPHSNRGAHSRPLPPTVTATPAEAIGSLYKALAEQRQQQQGDLHDEIKLSHQRAANMAYAHRYSTVPTRTSSDEKRRSTQHRKDSWSQPGAWGQESKAGGSAWQSWGVAAPAPSEVDDSPLAYQSNKKKPKEKEQKRTDAWQTNANDPWSTGDGGAWGQEANEWENSGGDNNGWDAPQPSSSKQKTSGAWAETDPWTNPVPLENSESWGAWDAEPLQTEKREEKKSGGIGKFFGKLFRRKSKGKEKHVKIEDNKPKRSRSKLKKKDSDSDKTHWPDTEELEAAERQQVWDEMQEGEANGWDTGGGWDNGEASGGWDQQASRVSGKQSNGGWGKQSSGGWGKQASGGWGKQSSGGWDKEASGDWGKETGQSQSKSGHWGRTPSGGWSMKEAWDDDADGPSQSRTHLYATQNSAYATSSAGKGYKCLDSQGEAILPAREALYGRRRYARDRIFWAFDPNQDQRVSMMLNWIEEMKGDISMFGIQNFLQERERGALFANVDYRPPGHPSEPAFDWLSFPHVEMSFDRTLGESVACYDPTEYVLVFVFLLSPSKKSMAIWRRKLPVPSDLPRDITKEIRKTKISLRQPNEYKIHIDEELPEQIKTPARSQSSKKWSKLRFA